MQILHLRTGFSFHHICRQSLQKLWLHDSIWRCHSRSNKRDSFLTERTFCLWVKKNAAGVIRDWRCILKLTVLPAVASLKVLLVIWNQQQVEVAVSPIVRIPLCSDSESQTHCSQSETVTYNWCLVWFQLMFLLHLYCGTYATFAYKASYLHLQFFCLLQSTKNGGEAER